MGDIKYVVFRQKAPYGWISHRELYNHEDVLMDNQLDNKFLNALNRFHSAPWLNEKMRLPFKSIWYSQYLDESKLDPSGDILFMFEDGSRYCFIKEYIEYLRKKYINGHICFASFNCSFTYPPYILKMLESSYDIITSFDRKDCERRGWAWYSGIYSKLDYIAPDGTYDSDVYFAGADKGRLPLVYEIYDYLTAKGLKCDFYVTSVDKKDIRPNCSIHFNEWFDYEDIVRKCCKTRCILDISQPGQDGETYRQGEASAYGIKLISNYQNMVNERYYIPEQMKIFTKAEDIDIDFIKADYNPADFVNADCIAPYKRLVWLKNKF